MGDELFAHHVPEGVFHFGFLNENVVFRVEARFGLWAFEVETEPFLDAVEASALGQVGEKDQVKGDGGGENGVAAQEVNLNLHGVA